MKPEEQRARHTVVAQLAKRQDNVEICVEALAKEIVINRAAHVEATQGTRACCDARWADSDTTLQQILARNARIDSFTLWERLRVLVLGHP